MRGAAPFKVACLLAISLSCLPVSAQTVMTGSASGAVAGASSVSTSGQNQATSYSSGTTRTISRRTYSRRINADGSVTEVPSASTSTSTSNVSVSDPAAPVREVNTQTTYVKRSPLVSEAVNSEQPTTSADTISTNPGARRVIYQRTPVSSTSTVSSAQRSYRVTTPAEPVRTVSSTTTRQAATTTRTVTKPAPVDRSFVSTSTPVVTSGAPAATTRIQKTNRVSQPAQAQQTQLVVDKSQRPVSVKTQPEREQVKPTKTVASSPKPAAPVTRSSAPEPVKTQQVSAKSSVSSAGSQTKLSADSVPDVETLHHILWSTLSVIGDSLVQKDYSRFLQILSPRMQSELSDADLPELFQGLEDQQANISMSVGLPALFEIEPYLTADHHLRLRGAFAVARDEALRFDLLYKNVDGTWFVDAVALANG